MRATRIATGTLATAIALLAVPAVGGAEYLVPPGNSAATQYTETVPTAGGHRDSEKGGKNRSAAKVLGERNARRLHEQGEAGRKVAEIVATTAPAPAPEPQPVESASPAARDGDQGKGGKRGKGGEGEGGAEIGIAAAVGVGGGPGPTAPDVSGSSGLGEILAQATGVSSSGQLGPLLPLAIAISAAWALAFLMRQRGRPTP